MKCIICNQEITDHIYSKEHVFPESIGGTLCIDNVCKSCNSKLGCTVDNLFSNNSAIVELRARFDITVARKHTRRKIGF